MDLKIITIYILFVFITLFPFFLFCGLILLFFSKTKMGKKWADYGLKRKFKQLSGKNQKILDKEIHFIGSLIIKVQKNIYFLLLIIFLLFAVFVGIYLIFYIKNI